MPHLMHAIKKWKLQNWRGTREDREREGERDECAFNLKKNYFILIEIIVQGGHPRGSANRSFLSV